MLKMREIGVADTHTHTMYSGFSKYSDITFPDCMTTPKKSVKVAEKLGLDVLCITDHNTIDGAIETRKHNKQLVVVGEEISSIDGEIIGLFLQEAVKPGLTAEETVEHIHEQAGIAIAPHPFSVICPCLGQKMHKLRLDGIEVFNALQRDGYSNAVALESCNGHAKLGGSDAHGSYMIGNGYTLFNGSSQEEFREAVKKKQTSFGGKVVPLDKFIKYSINTAVESSKIILNINTVECPMSTRISNIRNSQKMLYLLGSTLVYAFLPVPVAGTIIGSRILRKRGHKMQREHKKEGWENL